ncbi:MAG TPA: CusA/CzcA family heavy metal efflux RND transporter [Burkholderiales bacterium]|jgi:cobalt-zinc-cadmium resistance protein CzcA|nr:CusA/CzcA family heavy metal efflux RND transporter [Burkholderiales bacterium]
MLERLVTFCITQRLFVLLAIVALMFFGVRAVGNLPIEAFPDVQDVQVQIVTQYRGQAPEEVERAVSLPIEIGMAGTPFLTQVRSVSITGLSVVTLTFADGTNDYFARQQVTERLNEVSLPTGVNSSLGPLATAVGEIYRYVLEVPKAMPEYEARAIQDWVIQPRLRMVQGVADVVSFGGSVKEYQIRVDPYKLKRYNVTLDQVSQALSNNSGNFGGGLLRRGAEALVIRGIGLFGNLDDIGRTVITSRNGNTVLVSDIGDVQVGGRVRSGYVAYAGINSEENAKKYESDSIVQGIVVMTKGQNAAKIVDSLKERVTEIQERLPAGVRIRPVYDRTQLINHTVSTVGENLTVGATLVIAILIIFLRNWRAALIVAAVIPLSLLFAFIMMDARGVSANLISLGAVDFGIIIDSAVVVVEALMVKLAHARDDTNPHNDSISWRMTTLRNTVTELGHPILFSKGIIILAFLPIFTFQRVEGKIFSPVAFTLSFALLGAIILTLTLVPTLLSYNMRTNNLAEKHVAWMQKLQTGYRNLLERLAGVRLLVAGASVGLLVLTLALVPLLGSEFLPKLDEGNIWLTISMPPQTSLGQTKEIERTVRAILTGYPEVKQVVTQVGRPDDGTDPKGPNNLEILAELQPRGTWHFASKDALITDMSKKIRSMPGIPTNFSQVIQDNVEEALSGAKGEIVVKVYGPDLEILQDKADQIVDILSSIRGATDVGSLKIGGQTELSIRMDRAKIARLGVNINDVGNAIQTALAGSAVSTFYEGDRRFDVTLRLALPFRDAVDDVSNLQVPLPGGSNTVALAEVATIEIRQGASRIGRENGGRLIPVKVNLIDRDQGSFVAEAQARVAKEVNVPPGYYVTWGGQFENQQRALKRLTVIVPISLFSIFALLFWAFKSMKKALLVLMMIPFTAIGGFAGLALAGLHVSISAAVGFIAVAGISVQNGVIMLEHIIELFRNGTPFKEAISSGAVNRLRPILMTALMAGLGLLPAAISKGIGSETQQPFAVVIVGGIVSATIFTLILLPLLYPVFVKEQEA